MMFNLSTFDCLTDRERVLYNGWKKAKNSDRKIMREEYEEKIEGFQGVREISSDRIYNADDTPKEEIGRASCRERV